MESQAKAVWQWSNFLHDYSPPGRTPLHINFDETNVKLYVDGGDGFLVNAARKRKRTARSLTNNIPKGQLRGSITHVSMVCDDPGIQARLPQLIIIGSRFITKEEFESIEPTPERACLRLVRSKTSWMTTEIFEYMVAQLARALGDAKNSRTIYVYGDAYKAHIGRRAWQAFNRHGINYCIIPAKLTWILQPCDTHVFAAYKNFLVNECQRISVSRVGGRLSIHHLLDAVAATINKFLNVSDWPKAFYDAGLVGNQRCVSRRVLEKIGQTDRPALPTHTIPTLEQIRQVFPRNLNPPVDLLFVALERLAATLSSGPATGSVPSSTLIAPTPPAMPMHAHAPGPHLDMATSTAVLSPSHGTSSGPLHVALPLVRLRRLPSKPIAK